MIGLCTTILTRTAVTALVILAATGCVRTAHDRAVQNCITRSDGAPARAAECQVAQEALS